MPDHPAANNHSSDDDDAVEGPLELAPTAEIRVAGSLRRFVVWMLMGGVVGLVAALIALRIANRDPTPALTPEMFYAERDKSRQLAPPDYDIEVRVTGSQPATYRVEVRGGVAQAAWRNGQPLTSRRTFGTWSIPGMFSTISRDIESIERRAAGKADRFTPQLLLRARFDPRYHFPARYRRTEWGSQKGSTAQEATWEVTQFRVNQ
jgi:hypothetical protein